MKYDDLTFDFSKFKCLRCGRCCRVEGVVRLTSKDIRDMAEEFNMTEQEFVDKYATIAPDKTGFVFKDREDGACIMLEGDNVCKIQVAKPLQCRRYPEGWMTHELINACVGLKTLIVETVLERKAKDEAL